MIAEIVAGYAAAPRRMAEAGLDGVEIVGSHGYLAGPVPRPRIKLRADATAARRRTGSTNLLQSGGGGARRGRPGYGRRHAADPCQGRSEGLTESDRLAHMIALAPQLDYLNVIAGTSASLGGAVHIVPPMMVENAYIARFAAAVVKVEDPRQPSLTRIGQPQTAEQVLASG